MNERWEYRIFFDKYSPGDETGRRLAVRFHAAVMWHHGRRIEGLRRYTWTDGDVVQGHIVSAPPLSMEEYEEAVLAAPTVFGEPPKSVVSEGTTLQ